MTRIVLCCLLLCAVADAETGADAWLRYERRNTAGLPDAVIALGDSPVIASARQELIRGVRGMTGKDLRVESAIGKSNSIVIGTIEAVQKAAPDWHLSASIPADGFWLKT